MPSPSKIPAPMPVALEPVFNLPLDQFKELADDNAKKQFLGNYLYQFILKFCQENKETSVSSQAEQVAGRITGMILEGQTIEQNLYLFTDRLHFNKIVNQAINLLKDAGQIAKTEAAKPETEAEKPKEEAKPAEAK